MRRRLVWPTMVTVVDISPAAVPRPSLAWRRVLPPMVAVVAVLSAFSGGYGYHRDELYFRMLPPAWNYVDQPGLTPLLARVISGWADEVWAVRIPATLLLAGAVLVSALCTRELGGGAAAQTLSAWGLAFSTLPLAMGHELLTASMDLVVWPLVGLFVIRALLRDPRWWVATGALIGLSTYNKLLIVYLVGGLLIGLLACGPREVFRTRWLWFGTVVAVVLMLPALIFQLRHGWPQLAMGSALAERNSAEVRVTAVPFLLVLLGPPLVPIWVAGGVALWRRPQWRRMRALVVTLVVVTIATAVGGAQVYYPLGILIVVWAAGCVPTADWIARRNVPSRRRLVVAAVVLNSVVAAVVSLPVLPVTVVGSTPVADMNQTVGDQIGWPTYVEQIRSVVDGLTTDERSRSVIVATNYGEAGALDRFGPAENLPPVVSGHNALADRPLPDRRIDIAVVVGSQTSLAVRLFRQCSTVTTLQNGVGVANEEQGQPVAVCRDPIGGFAGIWPRLRHLG